jgi:hypothetical protein
VRLRLRVMLTTTTELESAMARPSVTAPRKLVAIHVNAIAPTIVPIAT